MKYDKAIFGIYPRSESLRVNIGRHERGKLDGSIRDIIAEEKRKFYDFAGKSNVRIAGDPLFNWHDIYRPLFSLFSGLERGELHRYKETNTFYRKPKIAGAIEYVNDPLKSQRDEFATPVYLPDGDKIKNFFLPSPKCFLADSENVKSYSKANLLNAYGDLLESIKPETTVFYEHYDLDEALLNDIASLGDSSTFIVVTPESNNAGKNIIKENNFKGIVSGNPEDLEKNLTISKESFIPFWNCKKTSIESKAQVNNLLDRIKNKLVDSNKFTICNTDFFDFLPRDIADKKVAFDGVA